MWADASVGVLEFLEEQIALWERRCQEWGSDMWRVRVGMAGAQGDWGKTGGRLLYICSILDCSATENQNIPDEMDKSRSEIQQTRRNVLGNVLLGKAMVL